MRTHDPVFIPGLFLLVFMVFFGCKSGTDHKGINTGYAEKGAVLFDNYGCKNCHSLTGEKMYGPSLNNILNKSTEVVRQGQNQVITIDKDYIRRSLSDPGYEKVRDFQNHTMPKPVISRDEIDYLVEYLMLVNTDNQ